MLSTRIHKAPGTGVVAVFTVSLASPSRIYTLDGFDAPGPEFTDTI